MLESVLDDCSNKQDHGNESEGKNMTIRVDYNRGIFLTQVKPTTTKSGIWKYFDDCLDGQHAKCKLCLSAGSEVKYKLSRGSTKSLRSHLERKHRNEWQDMRGAEESKEAEVVELMRKPKLIPGQMTMKESLDKNSKVDPQGSLQKKFDRLLLELIGSNFLAFSFIDSPEFHSFITFLNKSFNIKAACTYRKQMTSYAKQILVEVIGLLKEFCDVGMAATTDIWTSRAQDSYISLTAHLVDKHFRLHRFNPLHTIFKI